MSEQWIQWKPAVNLEGKYFVESICDMLDGLHIIFDPSEKSKNPKKLKFFFEYSVKSFRIADESCRTQMLFDLKNIYGDNFYGNWTFFKIENSSYLKWLSEQSCTITDYLSMQHICCIAGNSVLDLATGYEPEISLIENTKQNE